MWVHGFAMRQLLITNNQLLPWRCSAIRKCKAEAYATHIVLWRDMHSSGAALARRIPRTTRQSLITKRRFRCARWMIVSSIPTSPLAGTAR
jgi:hypothetical protein